LYLLAAIVKKLPQPDMGLNNMLRIPGVSLSDKMHLRGAYVCSIVNCLSVLVRFTRNFI